MLDAWLCVIHDILDQSLEGIDPRVAGDEWIYYIALYLCCSSVVVKPSRSEVSRFAESDPGRCRASPVAKSAAERTTLKLKIQVCSQMQNDFGGHTYRRVFPVVCWLVGRVCDEAAGDLTLQRGLRSTQSLIIHVIYKYQDTTYPLHLPRSFVL